jgi:hypothetical protein
VVACSQGLPPGIIGVGTIHIHNEIPTRISAYIPHDVHKRIDAEKKEVVEALSDGDNETTVAAINREFAEKQYEGAMVLLGKMTFLLDAVRGYGAMFDGMFLVTEVEASSGDGSTLVILHGTPFSPQGASLTESSIDLAIIDETIITFSQF